MTDKQMGKTPCPEMLLALYTEAGTTVEHGVSRADRRFFVVDTL